MKIDMAEVLILLILALTLVGNSEERSRLIPGVGWSDFVIGKTTRADIFKGAQTEESFAKNGIWFSFRQDDVLDTIVVTQKGVATDKGVHAGASQEDVKRTYGRPQKTKYTLSKGTIPVGTIGDTVYAYPGIHFIIAKRKVWAIVIVPK